jgi:RNA polymerase sigma-70 factor (ECF subfamily)
MTDSELVAQARHGQRAAYATLAQRWAPRVTALCHAKTGCVHAADDLAQETLLRGLRALDSLSDPDRFGAWLCGIALRASLDWLKRRKPVPFSTLADHEPRDWSAPADTSDLLSSAEDRARVLAEIEQLPEVYRQAILLFYYADHSYREMAHILGITLAAVNARLTRARQLLRTRLAPTETNDAL